MEHLNENTLLEAIRQGESSAYDVVFRRYYEVLCHYAAKFTEGDLDEAEDIVQQTFVKLWERRSALEITHSIKAYLYKTGNNGETDPPKTAQSDPPVTVYTDPPVTVQSDPPKEVRI